MSITQETSVGQMEMNRPWMPLNALSIGAFGFFASLVFSAIALTVGMRAYYAINLSTTEADAATIILADLAAAGAAYLAITILRIRFTAGFWQSIEWNYERRQCSIAAISGVCAALIMRFALTRGAAIAVSSISSTKVLFALVILGTVVMEPLIEEIYFRGILFKGLAARLGSIASITIVTVAFVMSHVRHHWIVLPISLLLALLRLRTKSTASCFALHAGYNLGVVVWGLR